MVEGPKRASPVRPGGFRYFAVIAAPFLLAASCLHTACGRDGAAWLPRSSRLVVVTQVPVAQADGDGDPVAPPGSRLVLLDLERSDTPALVLTAGLLGASHGRCTLDGTRILFTARTAADAPTSIWSCRLDGTDRRRVVEHEGACESACELPDGRIVCAARPSGGSGPRALWVTPPGGGQARPITFGDGDASDPCVLPDGRVLYVLAALPGESTSLWWIHPDGTGVARLPGDHRGVGRPCPGFDGRFVWGTRRGEDGALVGHGFEVAQPTRTAVGDVLRAALTRVAPEGVRALEPTADGLLLVVRTDGALVLLDPLPRLTKGDAGGARSHPPPPVPITDSAWRVVHAAAIAPRPRPQGHLSMVRPGVGAGVLVAIDARADGGGAALRVRGASGPFSPVPPLAVDGSVHLRVPPDETLHLEVLDEGGAVLGTCTGPLWVRSGETRVCVGCHHDRTLAPPNVRPAAILDEPVPVGPNREGR